LTNVFLKKVEVKKKQSLFFSFRLSLNKKSFGQPFFIP